MLVHVVKKLHLRCLAPFLPYFIGYKREFFFFQNSPKNPDLSYKTDLDLRDCLGRVRLVL